MTKLEEAADYIEANGWYRGELYGPLPPGATEPPACLEGAMRAVCGLKAGDSFTFARVDAKEAFRALLDECREVYGYASPHRVNDRHVKDAYEATDILRKAAKRLVAR